MFNFDMLFGDHMAKVSNQAKLYYIKLNFFASNGFVANPMVVLDSLGFDKFVFNELVANDELLTLPGRSEVFITSYFVHNPKFNNKSWLNSPFSQYWKGKLFIKKNGVATFNPQPKEEESDPLDKIIPPEKTEVDEVDKVDEVDNSLDEEWDKMFNEEKEEEKTEDDLPF